MNNSEQLPPGVLVHIPGWTVDIMKTWMKEKKL